MQTNKKLTSAPVRLAGNSRGGRGVHVRRHRREGLRQTPRLSRRQIAPAEAQSRASWTIFMSLRGRSPHLMSRSRLLAQERTRPREVGIARKQMKHWLIGQCGIVAIEKDRAGSLCPSRAPIGEKSAADRAETGPAAQSLGGRTAGAQPLHQLRMGNKCHRPEAAHARWPHMTPPGGDRRTPLGTELNHQSNSKRELPSGLSGNAYQTWRRSLHLVRRQLHVGPRFDRHSIAGITKGAGAAGYFYRNSSIGEVAADFPNYCANGRKGDA